MTDAEEVDVDGKKFRRLEQASSGTYFGRFGAYLVDEALHREAGVRNGPTLKPIKLRVDIVERMLPDMARVVGALSADDNSRALHRTLRTVGCVPPGRAFLQDHVMRMGAEIADPAAELEAAARDTTASPGGTASTRYGLGRMSVRMAEPREGAPCSRWEPYQGAPPPQMQDHYRKAWVGSVTAYDERGEELATWRCAVGANVDPAQLADRIAAGVAWLLDDRTDVLLHCVQDVAPARRALPEALGRRVPDVEVVELGAFDHLARYLDAVVDACDPQDEHEMKAWYRSVHLDDDNNGIDRIQQNLRRQPKRLPADAENARNAMAAALRYMRQRMRKMRYASF
ncbi:MAG: hypothetical protein IT383_18900 [Deltaproteobacteria bacterium]|nr:hypothetical protein [Deltaproteobacteria bacterium]